jgi:hypothetical protein
MVVEDRMPVYPCSKCRAQVDIRDVVCRGCGEQKPFKCTKCDKPMAQDEVYGVESINFQKPLFCMACGKDVSVVSCHRCNLNVIRSDAVEKYGSGDRLLFFHPDCMKTSEKQAAASRIAMLALAPVLAIGGAIYYWPQGIGMALFGLLAGVGIGFGVGWIMQPRM